MTISEPTATAGAGVPAARQVARIAVVVHWTDAASTCACVDALLADDRSLLVVVVDNASIDGSGDRLAAQLRGRARIELLRSGRNGGFGAGCNLGITRALALAPEVEHVVLVNPDAVVESGCIEALCETAHRRRAGIVGGRVLDGDGARTLFENGRFRPWTLGPSHTAAPAGCVQFRTSFVTGALMAIDADLLREGLRFDERYFLYVEDLDLCRQVVARGRELWIDTRAVVRHREGGSQHDDPPILRSMRARQLEHIARGKALFARKWLSMPQRAVFFLLSFLLRPVAGVLLTRNLRFLRPWFRGLRAGLRIPIDRR
ncbi:MAG: glycosyltransferase family 2 protein [Planctomycetota bacterium]